MDYFRRPHQSSYPPRPSPLGNSQESHEDRPRSYAAAQDPRPERRDAEPRLNRRDYSSPTQIYAPAARPPHPLRGQNNGGTQLSPPRNQTAHQHRRHASLESKSQPSSHRRNHSQPQSGQYRLGRQNYSLCYVMLSCARVLCPGFTRLGSELSRGSKGSEFPRPRYSAHRTNSLDGAAVDEHCDRTGLWGPRELDQNSPGLGRVTLAGPSLP